MPYGIEALTTYKGELASLDMLPSHRNQGAKVLFFKVVIDGFPRPYTRGTRFRPSGF
jgi:hypothetical protein